MLKKHRRKTIIAFIIWNVFVLFLWIWSREGSVVRVTFDVKDQRHCLYCDNILVDCFSVPDNKRLTHGQPGIGLSVHSRAPLRVAPQMLDDFFVQDMDTADILLEDDFSGPLDNWDYMRGKFLQTPGGRITSDRLTMASTGNPLWENYRMEVTCFNPTEAFLLFRVQDSKNYGRVKMRFWRELVVGYSYTIDNQQTFSRIKSMAESVEDAVKSLVLRFVKIYGVAWLILLGFLVLFTLVSLFLRPFLGTNNAPEPIDEIDEPDSSENQQPESPETDR